MKLLKFTFVLILGVFVLNACSSDDDAVVNDVNDNTNENNDNPDQEEVEENFFPLVVANSWDYENNLSSPGQDDVETTETLSITGTNDLNGNTVFELETDNPAGSSPVTLALSQGVVYKNNSSLLYTGQFGLGLTNFPEVNFDIENAAIYNTNASLDTELFSQSGNIQQEFQGIPLSIDYTLSTLMGDSFTSFESNGVIYDKVISSQLVVNLEVTANITNPLPVNIPILQSQDAVVVTNYFADGIGLIESETDTNLMFEDIPLPNFNLDDISFNTLQLITDFSVTLE